MQKNLCDLPVSLTVCNNPIIVFMIIVSKMKGVRVLHWNRGMTALVEQTDVMSGWNLPLVGMRS